MPKFEKTKDRHARNSAKIKKVRASLKAFFKDTDKNTALDNLNDLVSRIDKLAKHHIIHINKAGRLKSKCYKYFNTL